MSTRLTCIECPTGCPLTVELESGRVVSVSGHRCPRGEAYARSEIEDPRRILTSTVLASGLALKMVPVRTDRPIPRNKIPEAMRAIRALKITEPVAAGALLADDFLGLGVGLIAARGAEKI